MVVFVGATVVVAAYIRILVGFDGWLDVVPEAAIVVVVVLVTVAGVGLGLEGAMVVFGLLGIGTVGVFKIDLSEVDLSVEAVSGVDVL